VGQIAGWGTVGISAITLQPEGFLLGGEIVEGGEYASAVSGAAATAGAFLNTLATGSAALTVDQLNSAITNSIKAPQTVKDAINFTFGKVEGQLSESGALCNASN